MSMRYEEGTYSARVLDQELTTSKSGNSMGVLTIQILGRIEEVDDGEGGQTLMLQEVETSMLRKVYLVITETTAQWTADKLTKLGFTAPPSALKDKESTGSSLIGSEHLFTMKFGGDDGTLESWDVHLDGEAKVTQPTSAVQDLELDAAFGSIFKQSQASATGGEKIKQITAAKSANLPF